MTDRLRRLSSLLFGLSEPVDRRQYVIAGFGLMALKYAVDAAIIPVIVIALAIWTLAEARCATVP